MTQGRKDENGLTDKQALFVKLYSGNALKAALAAGYSEKSASQAASLCLRNPAVQKMLSEKLDREADPLIRDKRARLKWLVRQINNEKHKIKDRLRAYETLAKSCGDFMDGNILPDTGKKSAPPTIIVIKAGKESPVQVNIGDNLPSGEELPIEAASGEELPAPDGEEWPEG